jgi:hypothetical protein
MESCKKGLKSVNAKMMMSVSIVEREFPVMAIIVGYEGQLTPFPWSTELSTLLAPFVAFWSFCNYDLSP